MVAVVMKSVASDLVPYILISGPQASRPIDYVLIIHSAARSRIDKIAQ
jgi:hypothetical protein